MSGTTMPTFKAALAEAIKDVAAAPGRYIGYGDAPNRTRESIRLRESVTAPEESVTPAGFRGGRPRMDEKYTTRVECEVIGRPTPEACEAAVVALGALVEDALWTSPVQNSPGVNFATVSGRALVTDEGGGDGTRSIYELTITVRARTL